MSTASFNALNCSRGFFGINSVLKVWNIFLDQFLRWSPYFENITVAHLMADNWTFWIFSTKKGDIETLEILMTIESISVVLPASSPMRDSKSATRENSLRRDFKFQGSELNKKCTINFTLIAIESLNKIRTWNVWILSNQVCSILISHSCWFSE